MISFQGRHFKQLRYGIYTVLPAFIPALMAVLITQLLVDTKSYDRQLRIIVVTGSYSLRALIYYISAGLVHIVICSVVICLFSLKSNTSTISIKLNWMRYVRTFYLFLIVLTVYIVDNGHMTIAYLSHDRLYTIMSQSEYYQSVFRYFPKDILNCKGEWFRVFSLFPFFLIVMALAVMAYGGFYAGRELYVYVHLKKIDDQNVKEYVKDFNDIMKKYVHLLSLVMVSSTIATVLFLQLPVSLIKDEMIRKSYMADSISVGISWGIIFSLILLFLCMYPFRLSYKKTSELKRNLPIKDDPGLIKWLNKYNGFYSFMGNFKVILSITSPMMAGVITSLITHSL